MNYEDFITLIRKRRTIRAYKSDPVDDKTINQIIEAGKWAPICWELLSSAMNGMVRPQL